MKTKIVSDSSSDIIELEGIEFATAPLAISTDEREFIDDKSMKVDDMLTYLEGYKGKSRTACPSVGAWLEAFGDADVIYVTTITSNLSGSYNSAISAKDMYLQKNPGAKIHIFDTLSAGAEVRMLAEKIRELVQEGKEFEEVCDIANDYLKHTRLFFSLQSLHNLAQNGRVSKLVASAVGVLGIRIFGTASLEGTLEPISKCRNDKKVIAALLKNLEEAGYRGGKFYIAHVKNEEFANMVKDAVVEKFGTKEFLIYPARALCSFYAERGGLLIGCECEKAFE